MRILPITTALLAAASFLLAAPVSAQSPELIAEGATAWASNCVRCHNARPSIERNDRQWATIVAHMRVRANLTRSEAAAISAFLQATNAPEQTAVPPVPTPTVAGESEAGDAPPVGQEDAGETAPATSQGPIAPPRAEPPDP